MDEINWQQEFNKLSRQHKKLERNYHALALMHEQTERMHNVNETAKELSNFYNRLLLRNTPGITFMLDLNLCFVLGSERVVKLLGYSDMREMVGEAFLPLFSKTFLNTWVVRMESLCHQVMETNEVFSAPEESVCFANGGEFIFRIDISPAAEQDGICRGAVVVMSDVTEMIHARRVAEAASHTKGEFLARMSHEIRTPLNAVIGMTHIASNTNDENKLSLCLTQIASSSSHLLGVINDILDFSRTESGKLALELTEFSLKENIDFVLTMLESRATERNIRICLERFEVQNDTVTTDSLRLNQVLVNLLSNAVKFSDEGSNVMLSVQEFEHPGDNSIFRFEVTDSGIGITPQQAVRLFRPFEQADVSITRSHGGTGLGLAISKNLVEMMGGEIDLRSEEGVGSTFYFTICCPASKCSIGIRAEETLEPVGELDLAGRRCLIVDDIEVNRIILFELLADSGMELHMACNGQEALDMFAQSSPGFYDIILMDIQMPELDGCSATRKMRSLPRADAQSVRIVAMTANVMQEDVSRAMASGMDAYLNKPIELDNMHLVLRQQLGS